MAATDDWSVPISALQHYLYCPRQCALIHLEQIWTESALTAQGRLMHQRADQPHSGVRRGIRTVTAMPLNQPHLGIHGMADVVEFGDRAANSPATPVEYKRGRPKLHRADEVQLCAQALCLEYMLGQSIAQGALFYGEQRRRHEVIFDDTLRALTQQVIVDVRAMFVAGETPKATYDTKRCDRCSLLSDCQPRVLTLAGSVQQWLRRELKD
jgi:CRISPR-associated exonuclease Cas4